MPTPSVPLIRLRLGLLARSWTLWRLAAAVWARASKLGNQVALALVASVAFAFLARKFVPSDSSVFADHLGKALDAWAGWGAGLVIALLILSLLGWAIEARRRIVILGFESFVGKDEERLCEGLASRLRAELTRINHLYRIVDEISLSKQDDIVLPSPYVVAGDGLDEVLGKFLSKESDIVLGPVKIPVGAVLAAVSWLVQGPRLTGSLHQDGENGGHILIAELHGGGLTGTWRVDSREVERDPREKAGSDLLERMVQALACRITTSLLRLGSPRWQAVIAYNEGLRQYRETRRTAKDHNRLLRQAERRFLKALEEDQSFVQCHFNLGIVYREMKLLHSADQAFRRALEEEPGNHRAGYALAQAVYQRARYTEVVDQREGALEEALWLARNVVRLSPHQPSAWNLLGKALLERCERPDEGALLEVIHCFEHAALAAWRNLCVAEWQGVGLEEARDIARLCTGNLAIAYSMTAKSGRSLAAFGHALRLEPCNQFLNLQLGLAHARAGEWKDAHAVLDRTFEGGLELVDKAKLWTYLAAAHSHLFARASQGERSEHGGAARDCYLVARDTLALPGDETEGGSHLVRLRNFAETLASLGETPAVEGVSYLGCLGKDLAFLFWVEERTDPEELRSSARWLEGRQGALPAILVAEGNSEPPAPLPQLDANSLTWAHAQVLLRLGKLLLDKPECESPGSGDDCEPPEQYLEQALQAVATRPLAREFERHLLRWLARLYLERAALLAGDDRKAARRQELLQKALDRAQQAVESDPQSVESRFRLAVAYFEAGDYDQAEERLEDCLRLAPSDPALIQTIGTTYLYRARSRFEQGELKGELEKGKRLLEEALEVLESAPKIDSKMHAQAHYWLGVFHGNLREYEESAYHLRIASELGAEDQREVWLCLGWIYAEAKRYDEATEAYRRARLTPGREGENEAERRERECRATLKYALLLAERGDLGEARSQLEAGRALLPVEPRTVYERDLEALGLECEGWILYREGALPASLVVLEKSIRQSSDRSSAHLRLARCRLAAAMRSPLPERTAALGAALEDCRRVGEIDLRGLYEEEVKELEHEIGQTAGQIAA